MRGGVIVGGLLAVGKDPRAALLAPSLLIRKNPDWPNNVDDHNYAPWMRWAFDRDPMIADPVRLEFKADELYRRLARDMRTITFATWGNPEVHPYQIIRFIEKSGEAGVPNDENADTGALYIVSSVNHTLTERKDYYTTIDAELFEPDKYTFSPLEV
jgi:hypothetical protein